MPWLDRYVITLLAPIGIVKNPVAKKRKDVGDTPIARDLSRGQTVPRCC